MDKEKATQPQVLLHCSPFPVIIRYKGLATGLANKKQPSSTAVRWVGSAAYNLVAREVIFLNNPKDSSK